MATYQTVKECQTRWGMSSHLIFLETLSQNLSLSPLTAMKLCWSKDWDLSLQQTMVPSATEAHTLKACRTADD